MILNLKQLEAFVWVVDLGSFSKAAARLNTTQPGISNRIASLESALKVTLLERDAGSVRLTARGRELLEHARQVLKATEALVNASDDPTLIDGTLRLGVTEMIVHAWLRDFLKVLKDRFPSIQVELTVDLSVNLTRDLFERTIDLALQNGPFDRSTSGSEDLGTYPLVWVASPALGLPVTRDTVTAELTKHPILTHARDTTMFQQLSAHFDGEGVHHARLVPSSNLAACLFMAVNGMGVATLPRSMVLDDLKGGDLIELRYAWTPADLEFLARYDSDKSPLFVTEIAELARQTSSMFRSQSG